MRALRVALDHYRPPSDRIVVPVLRPLRFTEVGLTIPPAKLVGGMYDGARLPPASRGAFIWVGGDTSKPRAYVKPTRSRSLYRSIARHSDGEVYLYAANRYRHCENCGGFTALVEDAPSGQCAGCGANIVLSSPTKENP